MYRETDSLIDHLITVAVMGGVASGLGVVAFALTRSSLMDGALVFLCGAAVYCMVLLTAVFVRLGSLKRPPRSQTSEDQRGE